MSVEVIGHSALGRPLYGVVFNALDTPQQIQDYNRWVRASAASRSRIPRARRSCWTSGATTIKVPVFVQGAIHGNEYEGVESNMQLDRGARDDPVRRESRSSTTSSTTSSSSST